MISANWAANPKVKKAVETAIGGSAERDLRRLTTRRMKKMSAAQPSAEKT